MARIRVCAVAELPEGEMLFVDRTPPIAVYHSEGQFFATAGFCSHEDAPLTDGWLEDCQIECPWHSARFCLKTGEPLSPPATRPIKTYPVVVENGALFVELDNAATAEQRAG